LVILRISAILLFYLVAASPALRCVTLRFVPGLFPSECQPERFIPVRIVRAVWRGIQPGGRFYPAAFERLIFVELFKTGGDFGGLGD